MNIIILEHNYLQAHSLSIELVRKKLIIFYFEFICNQRLRYAIVIARKP